MRLSSSALRLVIGFGVSALLIAAMLRVLDLPALARTLAAADFRLLPLGIGLYFGGVWLRSLRWGLLLPDRGIPTTTLFQALVVGFTVNNVLPARLGELARAFLLARWHGVPYGTTLASVVVERVLDGLALAALLLLALAVVPAPLYLLGLGLLVGCAFVVAASLLALAAWRSEALVRLAERLAGPLPPREGQVLIRLADGFGAGLRLVRGTRRLAALSGLSALAWCAELSMFYVLMLAFELPASLGLALLGGTAANFATLVPSAPGYVGTFHGALVKVLEDTTRAPRETLAAYAVLVHATLYVPVVLLGLFVLWRSDLSLGQVTRLRRRDARPREDTGMAAA